MGVALISIAIEGCLLYGNSIEFGDILIQNSIVSKDPA
jgi:hypothetical protein